MAVNSTNYKFNTPTTGTEEDTWGDKLNENWDKMDSLLYGASYTDGDGYTVEQIQPDLAEGSWAIAGTAVTSTAAELNILDGVTATAAELNILDGVTSTTAELNILDGVTATATELNILDGVTATTAELNILDGVTATATELNILDGVTATTAELNILDGVTATSTEINKLDGLTASTTELNYVDGVTSSIQTQLNAKLGSSYTGTLEITGQLDVDNITINGNTISSTDTDGDITLNTNGAGEVNITFDDVNDAGTVNILGNFAGTAGPYLYLQHSTTTPGTTDKGGTVIFQAENDSNVMTTQAYVHALWNGDFLTSAISFNALNNGSPTEVAKFTAASQEFKKLKLTGTTTIVDAIRDEDDMASDDAEALATQQSIKAYVDSRSGIAPDASTTFLGGMIYSMNSAETNKIVLPTSLRDYDALMISIETSLGSSNFAFRNFDALTSNATMDRTEFYYYSGNPSANGTFDMNTDMTKTYQTGTTGLLAGMNSESGMMFCDNISSSGENSFIVTNVRSSSVTFTLQFYGVKN